MTTDRIEKQTVLRAPLARVWQAIADSSQFGRWFGMRCEGPFEAGKSVHCTIVPTEVDPEVAEKQKEWEGLEFDLWIEEVVPERRLSFRWIAHEPEEGAELDPETEPKTLVCFELEERPDGVLLTITESGFDALPSELRAKAFRNNEGGWNMQIRNIEGFLAS